MAAAWSRTIIGALKVLILGSDEVNAAYSNGRSMTRVRACFVVMTLLVSTRLLADLDISGRFTVISGAEVVGSRFAVHLGVPVTFRADQDGPGIGYQWTFSQGGTASTQEVTYTFTRGGYASVRLIASELNPPFHFGESQDNLFVVGDGRGGVPIVPVATPTPVVMVPLDQLLPRGEEWPAQAIPTPRAESGDVTLGRARVSVIGEGPIAPGVSREDLLRAEERRVIGFLLDKYGETDWSAPLDWVLANPDADVNPNVMMIPLSLAQAHLFRWRAGGDAADLEAALTWAEWVTDHHDAWGERWLSPLVVCYLEITSRAVAAAAASDADEVARAAVLRSNVLAIDAAEADARLSSAYPFLPLDSSQDGDTKAEEDAWESALLAAAASSLPDADHAGDWDAKARELAYDAITVSSDPPDAFGIKTTTVEDDFTLSNHGFTPNEYYTAATINLVRTGALFYFLRGLSVPPEFDHHVSDLFAAYRAHVDSSLHWTRPCDVGDATLFPLVVPGGEDLERRCVSAKAADGFLWKPGGPVARVGTGSDLFEAIEDAKTVEQYLLGSYLWRWPE